MTREKRDKAWNKYEEACLRAEENYRKDVEPAWDKYLHDGKEIAYRIAVRPAWEQYLKVIHKAKADLVDTIMSKNFHLDEEDNGKRILEPAWGKSLPCPYMPIICRETFCPCKTHTDYILSLRRHNDGGRKNL